MSVAFRRESDEEHKEPRFELPIPPGPNLVTARGLALIAARVRDLEAAIAAASEDDAQEALRRELRYWHTRHATAEIVSPPADGTVGIGSRVTFRLNGRIRTIAIVGADEADPATERVGYQAPLACVMIGGEAGERIDYGGVAEAIEIVAVEGED